MKKKLLRDFLIIFGLLIAVWVYFIYRPIVDSEDIKIDYKERETKIKDKLVDILNFKKVENGKTPILIALDEIQKLVQDSTTKYELYYSNSSEVNAYALPGNMIVINRGLILNTDSPSEIIGVLAHELGHLKMKHISEQMITSFSIALLFSGSGTTSGEIAKVLTQNVFSRDMEEEADDFAIHKMKEIGVSPNNLATLFRKLYTTSDYIPEFLNTHPGLDKRIKKFSKYKDKQDTIEFNFDWEKAKKSL